MDSFGLSQLVGGLEAPLPPQRDLESDDEKCRRSTLMRSYDNLSCISKLVRGMSEVNQSFHYYGRAPLTRQNCVPTNKTSLYSLTLLPPVAIKAQNTKGGKLILSSSAVVLALGLASLGISQSMAWYLASWLLIGVGMGSGLTDAAFSTLGNIYGEGARSAITSLTLFAGFASNYLLALERLFR